MRYLLIVSALVLLSGCATNGARIEKLQATSIGYTLQTVPERLYYEACIENIGYDKIAQLTCYEDTLDRYLAKRKHME